MKKQNVTSAVMREITSFEKQRSVSWIIVFGITVGAIVVSSVIAFVRTYEILVDRQAIALLEIFYEDREIFLEYWQDAAFIFAAELPRTTLGIGVCFLLLLGIYWSVTKRQRHITKRRLTELAKLRKSRNNTY